ncbi:MAG: nitronate monooxygenase [Porticoccaceae bacterium]
MNTQFCKMVGVEFPLVAFSHCRDVVVAVSKAGGFGVLGATTFTPEQLKIELDWIDDHIDGIPYGIDLAIAENMPAKHETNQTFYSVMSRIPEQHYVFTNALLQKHGVNTISAHSELDDEEVGYMHDTAERLMDEAFRHPIRLIVNALGKPPQSMIDRARANNVPVGALIGSKEHAIRQVEAGVDVLIAQGTEAAAHCGEVTTLVLVPEVTRAIQKYGNIPVLAAGGIVTGRQMAAAMTMGADGVWTGSVWLPTLESEMSQALREKYIAASSRDTVRSRSMSGKTARLLKTEWTEAWEGPESPGYLQMPFQSLLSEAAQRNIDKSIASGNKEAMPLLTYAVGQGVGMLDSIKSAKAVVQEFKEDFLQATERIASILE